ncbi:30S ribosomal protein S5 [Candidatus Hodgkinia cicadicola]|nr:30S ribosomal protein S5 [Candidatus Hodgkinia cicadicola]
MVLLRRVSKLVKGGHRYSALAVAGDAEDAAAKASQRAYWVCLLMLKANTTILRRLSLIREGSIANRASNVVRAVLDTVGAKDISVKLVGSKNPNNVIKALFAALLMLSSCCRAWGWQR